MAKQQQAVSDMEDVVKTGIDTMLALHDHTEQDIKAISFKQFETDHAAQTVTFEKLLADFSKICPDVVSKGGERLALGFCQQILYEISPASRMIVGKIKDKSWRCNFRIEVNGKEDLRTVTVATFKNVDKARMYKYLASPKRMILSMRLANMLATYILSTELAEHNAVILTPLAGAVFSATDIPEIATTLNLTTSQVCCIMNESTIAGAHLMPNSHGNCSVAAAVATTQRMKEKTDAAQIVKRIATNCFKFDKPLDKNGLSFWAYYARGGLPEGFAYEDLLAVCTRKVKPILTPVAGPSTASGN